MKHPFDKAPIDKTQAAFAKSYSMTFEGLFVFELAVNSYCLPFNNVEYKAQENIAITMVMSPLLKSKFFNISKFAFVIITITPIKEKITPII